MSSRKKMNCIQLKNTTIDNLKYFIQTFNSFVYSFSETIYSQTRWFFTLQKNNLSCFLHFQAIKVKGKYVLNKSRFTVRCSEHVESLNRHPCYSNLCLAKEEAQTRGRRTLCHGSPARRVRVCAASSFNEPSSDQS